MKKIKKRLAQKIPSIIPGNEVTVCRTQMSKSGMETNFFASGPLDHHFS